MTHLAQFILNHWILWLLLLVILIGIFIYELYNQKTESRKVSVQSAVELINHQAAVVIDLRPIEAFRKGHIIDAIRANQEDFAQKRMNKYKGSPIILVCVRGVESMSLANKLHNQGFAIFSLAGGITAWQEAGLPLIKGK